MASLVGKYAAKKLLGTQMNKHKDKQVGGSTDPFFEYVEIKGKKKKVKKQIPDFIPEHDAMVLAKAKSRAYHLDMSLFTIFGIRFGWESVIGLIPEIGDVIGLFFALGVWRQCKQIEGGLPSSTNSMMLLNIIGDFLIGLIPFVGDLIDASFKCNTRNVAMLEKLLIEKHGPKGDKNKIKRQSAGLELFEDDPDFVACNGRVEDLRMTDKERLEAAASAGTAGTAGTVPVAAREEARWEAPTKPAQGATSKSGGGWFNGAKREKQADPERGAAQQIVK